MVIDLESEKFKGKGIGVFREELKREIMEKRVGREESERDNMNDPFDDG